MLGLAFEEGPVAVKPRAIAPGAGKLTIDEGDDAAIARRGREIVGGDKRVDRGGEERGFGRGQGKKRLRRGWIHSDWRSHGRNWRWRYRRRHRFVGTCEPAR